MRHLTCIGGLYYLMEGGRNYLVNKKSAELCAKLWGDPNIVVPIQMPDDIMIDWWGDGTVDLRTSVGKMTISGGALPSGDQLVKWIVNDNGEMGVEVQGRCFFLYKGYCLEYDGTHDDGTPMRYRPVLKREFGECCHPESWVKKGRMMTRQEFVDATEGLEGSESAWRPVPQKPKVEGERI